MYEIDEYHIFYEKLKQILWKASYVDENIKFVTFRIF